MLPNTKPAAHLIGKIKTGFGRFLIFFAHSAIIYLSNLKENTMRNLLTKANSVLFNFGKFMLAAGRVMSGGSVFSGKGMF